MVYNGGGSLDSSHEDVSTRDQKMSIVVSNRITKTKKTWVNYRPLTTEDIINQRTKVNVIIRNSKVEEEKAVS